MEILRCGFFIFVLGLLERSKSASVRRKSAVSVAAMASQSGGEVMTLRNGIRCVPGNDATVEDVLLAVGELVGYDELYSASQMKKAVVIFLKNEASVSTVITSGIWVKDVLVPVTPLSAPATRVVVSNIPSFIEDEVLARELRRFGKFASGFKWIPLGCKDRKVHHVWSFRRQIFMYLKNSDQSLDVNFRVRHGDSSYIVFASTDSLRCFECGDIGHKKYACPHNGKGERVAGEAEAGTILAQSVVAQDEGEPAASAEVDLLETGAIEGRPEGEGSSGKSKKKKNKTGKKQSAEVLGNLSESSSQLVGGRTSDGIYHIVEEKSGAGEECRVTEIQIEDGGGEPVGDQVGTKGGAVERPGVEEEGEGSECGKQAVVGRAGGSVRRVGRRVREKERVTQEGVEQRGIGSVEAEGLVENWPREPPDEGEGVEVEEEGDGSFSDCSSVSDISVSQSGDGSVCSCRKLEVFLSETKGNRDVSLS